MSKIENEEIDWSKVSDVGSSEPKKDKKEIFKGLWLLYMFLCLMFFGAIVADIIDGTSDYLNNIKFFILFFIPCIIYLVIKAFKLF